MENSKAYFLIHKSASILGWKFCLTFSPELFLSDLVILLLYSLLILIYI